MAKKSISQLVKESFPKLSNYQYKKLSKWLKNNSKKSADDKLIYIKKTIRDTTSHNKISINKFQTQYRSLTRKIIKPFIREPKGTKKKTKDATYLHYDYDFEITKKTIINDVINEIKSIIKNINVNRFVTYGMYYQIKILAWSFVILDNAERLGGDNINTKAILYDDDERLKELYQLLRKEIKKIKDSIGKPISRMIQSGWTTSAVGEYKELKNKIDKGYIGLQYYGDINE